MEFLHNLVIFWFALVHDWGYAGVIFLMALESSIVPVPSEVVMPPAAFWAAQGKMSFWGVVFAGTIGSYIGSALSYLGARWIGTPILYKFGKYVFLPPEKLKIAERWFQSYGASGIFFARLLPVIRHLISIPAGVFNMNYVSFSISTTAGAFLWCLILSWYGGQVLGASPELLDSPLQMVEVLKSKMHWLVAGVVVLGLLYTAFMVLKSRLAKREEKA
jgi:membrane protein DedA with SNARE-associated domain